MIKKLITVALMLLLFPLGAMAGKPEDPAKYSDLKLIMNQVKAQYPDLVNRHIRIIIGFGDTGESWDAQSIGSNTIRVTYWLAQALKKDHNMAAAVFGHELYHTSTETGGTPTTEQNADRVGVLKANAAGYNGCSGAQHMLTEFAEIDGGWNAPNSSHGTPKQRYDNLPCGKGNK